MNITAVEVFCVHIPSSVQPHEAAADTTLFDRPLSRWHQPKLRAAESIVVRVETASGVVGWGETVVHGEGRTLQVLIEDRLTPLLIGADAHHIAPLWERMYATLRHVPGALPAIAAIDTALWDILGKHVGVPVARLLGAQVRERIPLCASGFTLNAENGAGDILNQVQDTVAAGFTTVVVPTTYSAAINHPLWASLHELGVTIAADARAASDFATARRLGRLLEQYDVQWIEAPLPPEHHHEGRRLSAFLDVPVAGGHDLTTRWAVQRALVADAFDIAAPDTMRAGGISECRRIAALVDTFGKPCKPAVTHGLSIGAAATLQLAAHVPNLMICEWPSMREAIASDAVRLSATVENGWAVLSEEPGLGITVDEIALRRLISA